MKKLIAICLAMGLAATAAFGAQDKSSEPVTHAQVAEVLVKALGLVSSLPGAASDQQRFTILMQNGICPPDGWSAGKALSKKELMIILVQALGAEDDVQNPEDPASWQAVLEANGISMANLGDADTVMDMESLPNVVAQDYRTTSVDPLVTEDNPARADTVYNTSVETTTISMTSVLGAVTSPSSGAVTPQRHPTPH